MAKSDRSIAQNDNFRRFWLGQAISTTGDAFGFVAMPLLILEATGSVVQMGIVTALTCAGQLGAGLFSGVVVDRVDRRRLMLGCDVGRMILYGLLPLLWWLGHPSLWVIYGAALAVSVLGNLFSVAYLAALPSLVDAEDIPRANGRLQATQALTYVVGAMLAGAVASAFGPVSAMTVDALSFGASAASLAFVRLRADEAATTIVAGVSHGVFAEMKAGFRFLFGQPILRALVSFQIGVALLASVGMNAAMIDVFVFRFRRDLGATSGVVGVALGVAAAGAILGALAASKLRSRLGFGACALGGTGIQAVGLALAGLTPTVTGVTAGALCWTAGLALRAVVCNSIRQTLVPNALLGRVMGASFTIVFAAGMAGAVLVTRVAADLGTARTLLYAGAALAAVTTLAVLSPLAAKSAGAAPARAFAAADILPSNRLPCEIAAIARAARPEARAREGRADLDVQSSS